MISSLPGSVSRMHVELLAKPYVSTSVLEALSGKLDIKRGSPSIDALPGDIDNRGTMTFIPGE